MQHALLMRVLHGQRHITEPAHRDAHWHWLLGDHCAERAALHQFHDKIRHPIRLADFMDGDDAWMLQPRRCLRLRVKARPGLRTREITTGQGFHRHLAIKAALPTAPHHTHAAATDLFENFAVPKHSPARLHRLLHHAQRAQIIRRARW